MADLQETDKIFYDYLNDRERPESIVVYDGATYNPVHGTHLEKAYAAAIQRFKKLLAETDSYEAFCQKLRKTNFLLVLMPTARNPLGKNQPIEGEKRKEILAQLISDKQLPERLRNECATIVSEHFKVPHTRHLSELVDSAVKIHISSHEYFSEKSGQPSFTRQTLLEILAAVKHPELPRIVLNSGADSFLSFSNWSKPIELVGMVEEIYVAPREVKIPPNPDPQLVSWDLDFFCNHWEKIARESMEKKKRAELDKQAQATNESDSKRSKTDASATSLLSAEDEVNIKKLIADLREICATKCSTLQDFQVCNDSSTAMRTAIENGDKAAVVKMTSEKTAELIFKHYPPANKAVVTPSNIAASLVAGYASGAAGAAAASGSNAEKSEVGSLPTSFASPNPSST